VASRVLRFPLSCVPPIRNPGIDGWSATPLNWISPSVSLRFWKVAPPSVVL